jgi:arylsulfatase A-like enzyme
MDIVPTLCQMTGTPLPAKKIDGINVLPSIKGKKMNKTLDTRYFYYFSDEKLSAVRKGHWKYMIPIKYRTVTSAGKDGKNGKAEAFQQSEALYHLENDISESTNVIYDYPEIASELRQALEVFDQTIKKEARPVGVAIK